VAANQQHFFHGAELFGSAWREQLANRKEPSAAKPQPKAELTTDPLRRRDSAASRTDAPDKGNPSNQRNPWFGIFSAAADSKWCGTHTCTHGSAQLCGHRTAVLTGAAPVAPDIETEP